MLTIDHLAGGRSDDAPSRPPMPNASNGDDARPEDHLFLAHRLARLGRISDEPMQMVSFYLQEKRYSIMLRLVKQMRVMDIEELAAARCRVGWIHTFVLLLLECLLITTKR